jgi:predicted RNA-binding protein YlxR (DUF448 family)
MKKDLKAALVRIAAAEGTVLADEGGNLAGRGGYLHPREECLERFVRSKVREFRSLGRGIDRAGRERIVESIRARLDRNRALE